MLEDAPLDCTNQKDFEARWPALVAAANAKLEAAECAITANDRELIAAAGINMDGRVAYRYNLEIGLIPQFAGQQIVHLGQGAAALIVSR